MNMGRRKSSLIIGSRTRKNVLKGKNVRKHDDGTDNFNDYWTDSDEETSNACSDIAQAKEVPSIYDTRLKILRQNVRMSQNSKASYSQSGITDPLEQFAKPPLKSVASNISNNVNRCSANELKLPSKNMEGVFRYGTGILSNRSSISDIHSSENESRASAALELSTSDENDKIEQIENTISLPKTNDKGTDTSGAIKNVQSLQIKGSAEASTSQHSDNAVDDHVKSTDHYVEPKSKEIVQRIRNKYKDDVNTRSKYAENTISPLAKKSNKLDETFVMHENVFNVSKIHKMAMTKAKLNAGNSVTETESGVQTFSCKPFDKRNNSAGLGNEVSNIFKTSFGNRFVKKISNSLRGCRTAERDDYDAEMMQMANKNFENENLDPVEKEHSFSKNSTSELNPAKEKKSESSTSKKAIKSTEEAHNEITSEEEVINARLSQRFYNLRSSEKISTDGKQKSSELENISYNASPHKCKSRTVNDLSNSDENLGNLFEGCRKGKETDDGTSLFRRKSRESQCALKRKSKVEFDTSQKFVFLTENSYKASLHKSKSQTVNDLSISDENLETLYEGSRNGKERYDGNSLHRRKSRENQSALKSKSNVASNTSEKFVYNSEVQKKPNSHLNISKTFPISSIKSHIETEDVISNQTDEVDRGSVSNVDEEDANDSFTNKIGAGSVLRCENDGNKEKFVTKTNEKLKVSKTFSRDKSERSAKIPRVENGNSPSKDNERKKSISNQTDMVDRGNVSHVDEDDASVFFTNEIEDDSVLRCENDGKKEKFVTKTNEKLEASKTFSRDKSKRSAKIPRVENGNTPSKDNERKKRVNKTNEKLEASQTFSQNKKKRFAQIPEVGKRDSFSNKREKHKKNDSVHDRGNNDQHQSSLGKKKSKKKNTIQATDNADPVRRSTRQKFPPLAGWRNERPVYHYGKDNVSFIGIDKGTGEDDAPVRQLLRQLDSRNKKKKQQKTKEKPKQFKLDYNLQKKKVTLVKQFDCTPWEKEFQSDNSPYRIKRIFETFNSAFGFIQIEINEEKPLQYMPEEDIYLTVLKGKLEITIQENITVVKEKDMIVIPKCIPYGLKNIGSTKALLVFCVGRFQYLESLP